MCPASTLIKALLTHLVLGLEDDLIMDMEAGIEHLGRATTQSMDALLIVIDESPWSLQTAHRLRGLAKDIGLTNLLAVVNRAGASTDLERLGGLLPGIPIIGAVPYDARLLEGAVGRADEQGFRPTPALVDFLPRMDNLLQALSGRAP